MIFYRFAPFQEFWEQKRRQEELERERLEALKKKEKHEQSAVASSEVKQKLQGFLLSKKQREATGMSPNSSSSVGIGPPSGSSVGSSISGATNAGSFQSHPYRRPLLVAKYDEDFPLRKTGE